MGPGVGELRGTRRRGFSFSSAFVLNLVIVFIRLALSYLERFYLLEALKEYILKTKIVYIKFILVP